MKSCIETNVIINDNSPINIVIDDKLYMFKNKQEVISELNRLAHRIEFLTNHIIEGVNENRERIARGEKPIKETSVPTIPQPELDK